MKILLVEDNPGDAGLLRIMFSEQAMHDTEVTHVECMSEAEIYVTGDTVDIILLDLGLPDTQGLGAVQWARAAAPQIPLVVLTGSDDETLALQALQEGAQDYLVKGQIEARGLMRVLRYAIERKGMLAQLRASKERAEQAESLLQDAVDSMSEGFVIYDREDRFVMCNEVYRQIYAAAADILKPGMHYEDVVLRQLTEESAADGENQLSELVAARVQFHRSATGAIDHLMPNGSWILATDRRMKNGGIAGLRVDVTALKQAREELIQGEARLDRAQAIARIGSWELDLATERYVWSKEMYRMCGVSPDSFEPDVSNVAAYVHPDDYASMQRWIADLADGKEQEVRVTRIIRLDREVRVVRVEGRAIVADGVIRRLAGTMQDITDRQMTERQLAQAQKMEAIGNLTGGMAHDFNNGLGIIIGNLDLLGRLVKADPRSTELCDEARNGAHRCADLIRLLLAFARQQPLHPKSVDVNELVDRTVKLLSRTLGEDITVSVHLSADVSPVIVDAPQLEAALTNLANNARDAMPGGGRLDITTKAAELDELYAALHPEANRGKYVLIEISDTGTGIAPEIIANIFEPFFTTKEPGKGSGLGLSMVFGFVKQSGGHFAVYSEPGLGSTFRIYLPPAATDDIQIAAPDEALPIVGGHETVLLVEDNAFLRRSTSRQLTELGYQVLEAEHASSALDILANGTHVELLFSDVVMPGEMDGLGLAYATAKLRPTIKVLLASGFPGLRDTGRSTDVCPFPLLNKPYRHDELARTVRDILDRPTGPTC